MQTDRVERGSLRVYLGAAPGVGKTFAMLAEGQRRAERGTDVVVGLVETHGRAKTEAAIADLEVLPRRVVNHGGMVVGELDVAAVLARRPEVVLVDELAHTNAVGPRMLPSGSHAVTGPAAHVKRWQDVEILLQAGIDVITTVNIQHLESLNDVVTSITGIRQRETVPDRVVRAAEAIELVDMSPQALRRRMAHGNVYAADKIDAALSNYFREGNLAALRELALLWLADRVDDGLDRYRAAAPHRRHLAHPGAGRGRDLRWAGDAGVDAPRRPDRVPHRRRGMGGGLCEPAGRSRRSITGGVGADPRGARRSWAAPSRPSSPTTPPTGCWMWPVASTPARC